MNKNWFSKKSYYLCTQTIATTKGQKERSNDERQEQLEPEEHEMKGDDQMETPESLLGSDGWMSFPDIPAVQKKVRN